jgi:hypothetical protein
MARASTPKSPVAAKKKAAKIQHLRDIAKLHKTSARSLLNVLAHARRNQRFRKQVLEDPDTTLRAESPPLGQSLIDFVKTLDASEFEQAMERKGKQFRASGAAAEAEAEAEAEASA